MGETNAGTTSAARRTGESTARRAALRVALAGFAVALPGLGPAGCGVPSSPPRSLGPLGPLGAATPLALLGVARAPGVAAGPGREALEAAAADALTRGSSAPLEPPEAVRTEIDPDRLDPILEAFGRTGAIAPEALQVLMAAPIRHRRALLLRVEENAVERLDPTSETVPGRPNERNVVQTVRRRVRVAATEIDLNGGLVRPLGAWTAGAEARVAHLAEGGDGFVASVAATLAARMAGRAGAPPPPEPPPVEAVLRVLFDEIARELPAR